MGTKFRKSISLGSGVKLNVGKKSVGLSAGIKGARVSANSSGRKTASLGIPGTGLGYVKTFGSTKGKASVHSQERSESYVPHTREFKPATPKNLKATKLTGYLFGFLFLPVSFFAASFSLMLGLFMIACCVLMILMAANASKKLKALDAPKPDDDLT